MQLNVNVPQDKGYLRSCSIYDFDLDSYILKIVDIDAILSPLDYPLPSGNYPIKRISRDAIDTTYCGRVHQASILADSIDEIREHAQKIEGAQLLLTNGSISLEVQSPRLLFPSHIHVILSISYDIRLTVVDRELLYAGAIQPSDYKEFQNNFGHLIPDTHISKQIVVTSRSKEMYAIRYFDASNPVAYPPANIAEKDKTNLYSHRWSSTVRPMLSGRASYFAVATKRILRPEP